jgi:hypothetical protein
MNDNSEPIQHSVMKQPARPLGLTALIAGAIDKALKDYIADLLADATDDFDASRICDLELKVDDLDIDALRDGPDRLSDVEARLDDIEGKLERLESMSEEAAT